MFDNIGGKIKGYAKIIFTIFIIAGIIGAIVTWIAVGGFGGFFLFLLISAVSVVIAYLQVMFIYAFGDLVENAGRIRRNTEEIYNINYETYSHMYDRDTKQSTSNPTPINANIHSSSDWRCSVCDTQNSAGDKFCKSCGNVRT